MAIITYNIPIRVPQAVIDAGGIKLFAKQYAHWQEKVSSTDENGNHILIDNPVGAVDHVIAYEQKRYREIFIQAIKNSMKETAEVNAESMALGLLAELDE